MTATRSWLANYSRVTRRRFLKGSAAGAGGAFLLACSSGSDSGGPVGTLQAGDVRKPGAVVFSKDAYKLADQTKESVPGGVLTQSMPRDFTENFDVYISLDSVKDHFVEHSYEYLLVPNRGPGIAPGSKEYLTLKGGLAESWEISPDALSLTLTMRHGVKFHSTAPVNGREMNMDDWRSSLARYVAVGSNSPAWNEVIERAEFPDSKRMVLKMKEPYVPLANRLWDYNFGLKVVPKELNEKPDLAATQMIGTGFRMLDKAQPSVTYEFKKFDNYWQGKPLIDRWQFPVIPEYANRYAQFLARNVSGFTPTSRDALKMRSDAPEAIMVGGEIITYTVNRMIFGKREKDTVPWKDARVRQALHRAVDWEAISRFQSDKERFAASGIEVEEFMTTHVPGDPSYYLDPRKGELGKSSDNYKYDLSAVKQLLEAAGFGSGFDIDMYFNAGTTTTPSQQNIDEWNLYLDFPKKTNGLIRMHPIYLTNQEYLDRIVYAADIKGIQYNRGSAGTDIDYNLFRNYSSKYHLAAYTDPKLDAIIDAQRRERDPLKRAEQIKEFQRFAADQFNNLPGPWRSTAWSFQWDWLRNTNYRGPTEDGGHLEWLDPNTPRRNG